MKKTMWLAVVLLSLSFVWASCSSDSEKKPDPATDVTGADTEVPAEDIVQPGEDVVEPGEDVVEPGEDVTEPGEDTITEPPPTDQCLNPDDGAIIQPDGGAAASEAARECGMGCMVADDIIECATPCVVEETGLSEGCSGCYVGIIVCTIEKCISDCITDSTSAECVACQMDKGCLPDFYQCTGFDPPEA